MNENYLENHSKAKLELYKNYLQEYLLVMGNASNFNKINIYDFFCGKGVYENGVGSPLIAAECICESKAKWQKEKEVLLCVNDIDPSKIESVRKVIIGNPEYSHFKFESYCSSFSNMVESITQKSYSNDEHTLMFVDPYGYKDIKLDHIQELMGIGKAEMIIFIPASHLFRFIKPAIGEKPDPAYIPLRNFIKEFNVDEDHHNILDFIENIKNGLSINGKYFTESYYIERSKSQYFALFFITKNLRGLEKILSVKWKLDPLEGIGFDLNTNPTLFDQQNKENRMEKLRDILIKRVEKGATNNELYEITLRSSFLPTHATKLLTAMKNDLIIYDIETGGKGKGFYINYKDFMLKPKVRICKR